MLLVFLFSIYCLAFVGKIYPNVHVLDVNVGGLTQFEAQTSLSAAVSPPEKLTFVSPTQEFTLELSTVDFRYNYPKSADAALAIGRSGNYLYDFWDRVRTLFSPITVGARIDLSEEKFADFLSVVSGAVSTEPVYPSVELIDGSLVIERGRAGVVLDKQKTRIAFGQALLAKSSQKINLPLTTTDPAITEQEAAAYKSRAEKLVGKKLVLVFENSPFIYSDNDILKLLAAKGGYSTEKIAALINDLAPKINRQPQNSIFKYENGQVREFVPSQDGIEVKTDSLQEQLIAALEDLETSDLDTTEIAVPVNTTEATVKTKDVNSLGINELIGHGSSRFVGSIASRIHNIGVATARFNGALVAPGETFSFNDILGDVSEYTGYKQAYVIRDGQTVLGDGGGVCQVSTTLFRAALDAGLPIVERRAHSYRVGYYEQDEPPGLDATVFAPTTDLKIKNDTPGHILIQTQYNPKAATLVFDIYGTSDGRVATHTKPVVYDYVAPPEDLYIDDPSKPAGFIQQIDWKAAGSKAKFDYTVTKDGKVVYEKTFFSNYKAWQSKFIRGTGPAI